MKHLFLLYVSLIFAFIASPSSLCNGLMRKLSSETELIKVVCRKSSDFGFCVYTLRSDSRSKGADTNGLAHIAVDKLQGHAKETSDYLQDLQKNVSDPKLKGVVNTCIRVYKVATDKDVPFALKSLDRKAYGDAITAASAAMNEGEDCQKAVTKKPSHEWQMISYRNKYMHDLSQLVVDLIKLL